jgi:hypothetical protein
MDGESEHTIHFPFTTSQIVEHKPVSDLPASQLAQYTPMLTDISRCDKPAIYFTISQSCCSQNQDLYHKLVQGMSDVESETGFTETRQQVSTSRIAT